TAAFRPLETVGFPLRTPLRAILLSTTILISGLHHAACILAPSSFVPPLLGVHVEFATDRLAKLWSGGTCTVPGAHPLGNNNQFHGFSPTPKVSGLPWRDQCLVRRRTGPRTPHRTSAARRGVSAPQEEGGPFGTPLLAVHATGRHVEGLAHPKSVRLPFPRQREFASQNEGAGVKGMGVWCPGDVGHHLPRFDLRIAITLSGGC